MNVGVMGLGMYLPSKVMTSMQLAKETGIPVKVIEEKYRDSKNPYGDQ